MQRPENSAYDDNEDDSRSGMHGDDQPAINNDSSNDDSIRQESAKRTVSMEQFMASRETPRRAGSNTLERSGSASTRQERRELEIKMENMKECTFQPQITELPKGYAATNLTGGEKAAFHHRCRDGRIERNNNCVAREIRKSKPKWTIALSTQK